MTTKTKYRITWGANFTQIVYSKKAALSIAAELLNDYTEVTITIVQ